METFRKTIKKIAAITSGALMAATCFGVAGLATDLSSYPAPFVTDGKWVGLIAVGADAATADVIGAVDVATTLAQVVSGTTGTTTVSGGKEKELDLGDSINDTTNGFSNALDDDDLAGFQDTSLNIDLGDIEDDYDVHDELQLGKDATTFTSVFPASIQTGLTYADNQDEDFKENAFMAVPKSSIGYYYIFDDALVAGNEFINTNSSEPIDLDFLGKKLTITSALADGTGLTAQIGEEFFLNTDDTVTVLGHVVKLINVGSGDSPASVVVSVDGTQETVSGTEKVDGLRIKVKETFYSDTKAERSATLIIGEDATKSYTDGDGYIGESEDDPNWVWDLNGLNGVAPRIGILFDQTYDDPTEVVTLGSTFALPNNYATIKLEGYTVTDVKKYTIGVESGETLCWTNGTDWKTSAKVLHFHAEGTSDDGFSAGAFDTDDVYLYFWYDVAGATKDEYVAELLYKDHDDANKIKLVDDTNMSAALQNTTGALVDIFSFTYKDTTITVDGTMGAIGAAGDNYTYFILDEQNGDNAVSNLNLTVPVTNAAFEYIGHSDGDTITASDLLYDAKDISGWEENTRTQKGLVVYSYDDSASGDEVELDVPSDITDFAVKTLISSSGTKVVSTGTAGTLAGVPVAKTDTEITDAKAQNLILVGGTAVNKLTAQALGVTYPTYGTAAGTAMGITTNEATLKLVENAFGGTNVALIVAGWEAADTRNAANVLKDYTAYAATLTGKQVVVKSTAGTITLSAPTVAATNTT